MTTQLSLYNGALRALGERKLASLSEDRKPRRLLDAAWDDKVIKYCLEQGQWKFAQRTSKLTYQPSYTAPFGYRRQFVRPSDCVRLTKVCSDEFLDQPLLDYAEEAGFWFANLNEISGSYVSDAASYGSDMSLWPESFVTAVQLQLACEIAFDLTQSKTVVDAADMKLKAALTNARSKDAMQNPTQFPPAGGWVRSRAGGRLATRKNRSTLLG